MGKAPRTLRHGALRMVQAAAPGRAARALLAALAGVASAGCQFPPRRDGGTDDQHGCHTTNPGGQSLLR